MIKIFLGGTCGQTDWRLDLEKVLDRAGLKYFDPFIRDRERIDEDKEIEIDERESCDYVLYVINHEMKGVYSIAEVVDDSNKKGNKTLFYFEQESEDIKYAIDGLCRSLKEVGELVERNGGRWFRTYEGMTEFFLGLKGKLINEKLEEVLSYTE